MKKASLVIGLACLLLCSSTAFAEEKKFIEKTRLLIESTEVRPQEADTTLEVELQDKLIIVKMVTPDGITFTKTYEITARELGTIVREEPQGIKKLFSALGKKPPKQEEIVRAYMIYGGYISFITVGESFLISADNYDQDSGSLIANAVEYRFYEAALR